MMTHWLSFPPNRAAGAEKVNQVLVGFGLLRLKGSMLGSETGAANILYITLLL